MISLTAEYALRAAAFLAAARGESKTVTQVSQATQIPPDYLSKVLQEMSKSGLVRSQRGMYGGFRLVKEPSEVTVLQVVEAVSPLPRIDECPLDIEHPGGGLCPIHKLIDEAAAQVKRTFSSATLADLVDATEERGTLCMPRVTEAKPPDGAQINPK